MTRAARFEVVRTTAGWHARFRAANGQVVWVTESYTRRAAAVAAVDGLTEAVGAEFVAGGDLEIRAVDERGPA